MIIINGSPKVKDSTSSMFISKVEEISGTKSTVYQAIKLMRQDDISVELADIMNANSLLFVFPLYVDSLPAPLIKILTMIEHAATNLSGQTLPKVYAICNCGFYEAKHNFLALDIIKNFCARAGMTWGYGIGIGGGGFVSSQSQNMSKGPATDVYAALCELCAMMQSGGTREQNVFAAPKIPRFLYKLGGNIGWPQLAKKYGLTKKSLGAKPNSIKK